MRILQVIDSLQLGGAETLLRDIAVRWKTGGLDFDIAVLKRTDSHLEQELAAAGVQVKVSDAPGIYSWRQVSALARLLPGYDLVHVHLFPAQLWVALAAKVSRNKAPLVTTEHSTYNTRRAKRSFRAMDRWMYAQYRRLVCVSEATAEAMKEWTPGSRDKLTVIPNGVEVSRYRKSAAASKREIVGDDVPVVASVGRFEPAKNHTCLLQAMARLPYAHLVLIGEGPLRAEAEQLAQTLGIAQRVHFLGRRTDVRNLLRMADVYVQPSRFEGFGLAALEAMAAGVPVVASAVPGLASLVAGAGALFPSGNPRRLAEEMDSLLRSPERRAQLAAAGARRADGFSIDRTAQEYVSLYREVLGYDA